MKDLHCPNCQSLVYFGNTLCLGCGTHLVFDPNSLEMLAEPSGTDDSIRFCQNHVENHFCNWCVDTEDPEDLCQSCRLTSVLPDLSLPDNLEAVGKLERAKRILLYNLYSMGLRPVTKEIDPEKGLTFKLLQDTEEEKVLTGHAEGVITINIAEADDVVRTKMRAAMGEPYRTLLGHFRHEVGHYYWDRLLLDAGGDLLDRFRDLFGDDRVDYGESLERYYSGERDANWRNAYISEYASSHPWEDWAESWAHYLHISALVETANSCGVSVVPKTSALKPFGLRGDSDETDWRHWPSLVYLVNQLSRSLGYPDAYPFVISERVERKLEFIDEVIRANLNGVAR